MAGPDYNPDKEGHRGHSWVVMDATQRHQESVPSGKGDLRFDDQGRFVTKDQGLANEIRTSEAGRNAEVTVTRMTHNSPADRGHTYFFGSMPEMPWKRKERLEKEAKEKEAKEKEGRKQNGERQG